MKNVAGSGARWLDVSAERFPGWIASFAGGTAFPAQHGVPGDGTPGRRRRGPRHDSGSRRATGPSRSPRRTARLAECHPPFAESFRTAARPARPSPDEIAAALAAHAAGPRTVGVLLVRLGGYAAGVFTGYPPALGRLEGRVAPGARPQRGGRLVAAPLRPPPGEAGERGARRGGGRGGRRLRPRARGWTRSSSAGTSGRSPSCATTRGSPRTWPSRRSGSSPCPTPSGPSCSTARRSCSPRCE